MEELIKAEQFDKVAFTIDAQRLRLKIIYSMARLAASYRGEKFDLGYIEVFQSLYKAFRKRVDSTKLLNKKKARAYLKFSVVLDKIFKRETNHNYHRTPEQLMGKLESYEVLADREWLIKQIEPPSKKVWRFEEEEE